MISYLGVIRTVMIADTGQFNRSMMGAAATTRNAARQMRMSAQSLVGIGAALNVAVTMPVIIATRAIVKFGAAYDTQMMKIRHVTGLTTKDMLALDRAQVEISRSTGMRISELQQIGYLAAQAQILTVKGVAAIQRSVAKAQAILKGDAPSDKVAEGFLSILKSFNVEEKDFELVMAQMVKTIDLGRMTWEQYAGSIQQVAAIAASMKGSPLQNLQNLNIALALASQGGVAGGSVATAIRNIYTRVYKQGTKKNASFMDLMAQQVGATGAIDLFEKGSQGDITKFIKNITQDGKFATPEAATLMGVMQREITAFLRIGKTDPAEIDRFVQAYGTALDDLNTRFKDASKETRMAMARVVAEFEIVRMKFWKAMGGWPTKFLNGVADFLKRISDMPDSSKRLLMLVAGLAALGSALLLVVGLIRSAVLTLRLNALLGTGGATSGIGAGATAISSIMPKLGKGQKFYTPKGSSVPTQIRNAKGQIVKNLWAGTAAGGAAGGASGGAALGSLGIGLSKLIPFLLTASKFLLKFAIIPLLISAALKAVGDVFMVIILPALQGMGISGKSLGNILKWVGDLFIAISRIIGTTIAGLSGVLQDIFSIIYNGAVLLWYKAKNLFKSGESQETIDKRMSIIEQYQDLKKQPVTDKETRRREFNALRMQLDERGLIMLALMDKQQKRNEGLQNGITAVELDKLNYEIKSLTEALDPDQLKMMELRGGLSEALRFGSMMRNLDAMEAHYKKVGKRPEADVEATPKDKNKQEEITPDISPKVPEKLLEFFANPPESSAFLEAKSASAYEAVSSSRNSVIDVLNKIREEAIQAENERMKDASNHEQLLEKLLAEAEAQKASLAVIEEEATKEE